MAQSFFFSSTAQPTTLSASISNAQTSIPLVATTGFPVSFPFTMALDYGTSLEELTTVTSLSGLNANVIRAVDGTSASAHSVGAVVRHVSAARDFNNFYIHIGSSAGVHGIVGNVVGDSDTQTLSSKTLVSPTLTGTVAGSPTFSGSITFSGNVALNGTTTIGNVTGGVVVSSGAIGTIPLISRGFSGQTADLFEVQNSATANMFRVLSDGRAAIAPTSTTLTALTVNAPTATTGDLQDWQVNGTNLLQVLSTGELLGTQSAATGVVLAGLVTADTFDRVHIRADGRIDWGPGNATRDTDLYRNGVGVLQTDTKFVAGSTSGGGLGITGQSVFTQLATGSGSVAVFNGGSPGNTQAIITLQNNGSQVASVDVSGNWIGGVTTPASFVGYTATNFKAADTSRASTTTITSDPDLTFGSANFVNGATYKIQGYIYYIGGAVGTSDLKLTMAATSGSVTAASSSFNFSAPTITNINNLQAAAPAFGTTQAYGTGGGSLVGAPFQATFNVSAASTAIALQWAQNTSSATATVLKAGSWMTITRIA